jgi:hypothetical protein
MHAAGEGGRGGTGFRLRRPQLGQCQPDDSRRPSALQRWRQRHAGPLLGSRWAAVGARKDREPQRKTVKDRERGFRPKAACLLERPSTNIRNRQVAIS